MACSGNTDLAFTAPDVTLNGDDSLRLVSGFDYVIQDLSGNTITVSSITSLTATTGNQLVLNVTP